MTQNTKVKLFFNFINDRKITLLANWTSCSPDLNPIENIWNSMKREVQRAVPTTKDRLEEAIIDAWDKLPEEVYINSINSMNRRLRAILETKGERISY